MRTMNVEAVHSEPVIEGSGLARIRYLTRGAGYAVALISLLSVGWLLQALLDLSMLHRIDAGSISLHPLAAVSVIATASLPAMALMIVAVNLAPSAGVLRVAWLLLIGLLSSLWSQGIIGRGMPDQLWYACFIEATLWTSSGMAVLLYHRDLSGAGGRLLRATIDQTAMDAEFKRAQLRLLRAQIEPHFLFNTLATVKSLAQSDRNLTIELLENLGCYFTAALPRMKEDAVRLEDEMLLIDSYLAIFQVRMGARLTYNIEIPDSLKPLQIPPLILLTLVENALKHGLSPLIDGGCISITGVQEHSFAVLRVIDTGSGMDLRGGYGFGLANVRQRLIMLYGASAVLTLLAGKPRGVVATIRIPVEATEASRS
jgi:hypothetical protein